MGFIAQQFYAKNRTVRSQKTLLSHVFGAYLLKANIFSSEFEMESMKEIDENYKEVIGEIKNAVKLSNTTVKPKIVARLHLK